MENPALKQLIERILRCKEAEDEAKADTKDVYAEAASNGYDKTQLGRVVSTIRKRAKDGDKFDEAEAIYDLYLAAYDAPSHAHVREEAA